MFATGARDSRAPLGPRPPAPGNGLRENAYCRRIVRGHFPLGGLGKAKPIRRAAVKQSAKCECLAGRLRQPNAPLCASRGASRSCARWHKPGGVCRCDFRRRKTHYRPVAYRGTDICARLSVAAGCGGLSSQAVFRLVQKTNDTNVNKRQAVFFAGGEKGTRERLGQFRQFRQSVFNCPNSVY